MLAQCLNKFQTLFVSTEPSKTHSQAIWSRLCVHLEREQTRLKVTTRIKTHWDWQFFNSLLTTDRQQVAGLISRIADRFDSPVLFFHIFVFPKGSFVINKVLWTINSKLPLVLNKKYCFLNMAKFTFSIATVASASTPKACTESSPVLLKIDAT